MNKFLDKYSTPISLIIAGFFIIGVALWLNFYVPKNDSELANVSERTEKGDAPYLKTVPISENDRILGNKNAKVKVVTYVDMECLACIIFADTMKTLISEYDGQVAWVMRHFPLDFNENAMPAAIASECVAHLEGEEKFWDFVSKFKDAARAREEINVKAMAVALGTDGTEFDECYNSGRFSGKIDGNRSNAIEIGLQGTPHSVIFANKTPVGVIKGAYPIERAREAIKPHL